MIKTSADTELLLICVSGIHLLIRDHFIIMPQKNKLNYEFGTFSMMDCLVVSGFFFFCYMLTLPFLQCHILNCNHLKKYGFEMMTAEHLSMALLSFMVLR